MSRGISFSEDQVIKDVILTVIAVMNGAIIS